MATDVTTRPQYLNANNLIYSFWDLRRYMDSDPPGPGVADYESFRVQPRQAGANLSVDVGKTAVGLMQAWVRGSTRDGQGLYRVDNIDVTAPTANTYLAQLNVAVTSNASGNPRLDQVVLVIGDAQHAGAINKAYIDVIAGTPTAAASLDNRNGFAALPASCILLADILLASGDATVDAVDIRDRRPYPLFGAVPAIPLASGATLVDAVGFVPHPSLPMAQSAVQSTPSFDSWQSAALMYLPRRIVGATKIRWKYQQTGTANAGNYVIAIFDASGRAITGATTGAVAYAGALNTFQVRSETITATTFEPGWYYVFFGNGAGTASAGVTSYGASLTVATAVGPGPQTPNAALKLTSGGTTVPATLLGFSDVAAQVAAGTNPLVPAITLSVG